MVPWFGRSIYYPLRSSDPPIERSPIERFIDNDFRKYSKIEEDAHTINPCRQDGKYHPAEQALELASYQSESNYLESFKLARAIVVEYLEPQYQRLVDANSDTTEFVKERKRYQGDNLYMHMDPAEALLCLEKYADAFKRDMPAFIKPLVRQRQHLYNAEYQLELESILEELSASLVRSTTIIEWLCHNNMIASPEFVDKFKKAVDIMDTQFFKIRKARLELFDCDYDSDYGCDIDLGSGRCDDMIDWDAREPNITVNSEATEKDISEKASQEAAQDGAENVLENGANDGAGSSTENGAQDEPEETTEVVPDEGSADGVDIEAQDGAENDGENRANGGTGSGTSDVQNEVDETPADVADGVEYDRADTEAPERAEGGSEDGVEDGPAVAAEEA